MRRRFLLPNFLGLAAILLLVARSNAQFDELARRVPSSANAVAFVNVEKLMASPVAVKEKWAENQTAAWDSGLSMLPPDTKQAVLAMQLDLQMWLPLWEVALMKLDHEPSIEKVVAMTGGSADQIGGLDAVGLPEDAYLVKFDKRIGALMAPANRQSVARWLKEVDARPGPGFSPYLSEAYVYANQVGTPVILALDMEDAVPLDGIKAQLEENKEFLAQYNLDVDSAAKTLSGIRGLTLGITFDEKPFGKVKVDFRDNVSLSPGVAKAALIHALQNHGAMIDEFADWKPAVTGKQVTLEGYLTESGIRRISSLFSRPPSLKARDASSSSSASPESKEQMAIQSSKRYFQQIDKLLNDLKATNKSNSNASFAQVGVWMSKYAGKIDQLSVLNVDPEIVDYAGTVSDSLRAAHNAITSGAARSRIRQVNMQPQYDYYTYGTTYGYTYRDNAYGSGYVPYGASGTYAVYDRQATQRERTRIRTEERVTSANSAREIVQNLQKSHADMRRRMTQKYDTEF